MKTQIKASVLAALFCVGLTARLQAQGTAFTYQGQLQDNGQLANGVYDLEFRAFDLSSGGVQQGSPVIVNDFSVSSGLFSVTLDLGASVFTGPARWLNIAVRPGASTGAYTPLTPRQPLLPAPYAIYAGSAANVPWSNLSGVPAGFADGNDNDTTYTPGTGLSLAGTTFSVNFAGSGSASTAARTDHHHDAAYVNASGDAMTGTLTLPANGLAVGGNQLVTANNGNVGIGTVSPQLPLEVGGSARFARGDNGYLTVDDAANARAGLVKKSGSGPMFAHGSATPFMIARSSGTSIATSNTFTTELYIDPAGNVGIGTTSPSEKLSVNGTVRANVVSGNSFVGNGAGLSNVVVTNLVGTLPQSVIPANVPRANSNVTFTGTVIFNPSSGATLAAGPNVTPCPPPFEVKSPCTVNDLSADLLDGLDWSAVFDNGNPATGKIPGAKIAAPINLNGSIAANDGVRQAYLCDGAHAGFFSGPVLVNGSVTAGSVTANGGDLHINGDRGLYFEGGPQDPYYFLKPYRTAISAGMRLNGHDGVTLSTGFGLDVVTVTNNKVGIGTTTPVRKLEVSDRGHVEIGITSIDVGGRAWTIQSSGDAGNLSGTFQVIDRSAGVARMIIYPTDGRVQVGVLTITGGADIAEPFPMSTQDLPKGSVVIIDEVNAGQLKMSERACDTRVAGIISGAGGVSPGIQLKQEGVLDAGQNVALSGRVYVQADASNSPIKPGDLLTTSDTPGHAMKVTDHVRAQGAILGKAMSALAEGQGLVLVLVTLQ